MLKIKTRASGSFSACHTFHGIVRFAIIGRFIAHECHTGA